jgi:hypothetical protein
LYQNGVQNAFFKEVCPNVSTLWTDSIYTIIYVIIEHCHLLILVRVITLCRFYSKAAVISKFLPHDETARRPWTKRAAWEQVLPKAPGATAFNYFTVTVIVLPPPTHMGPVS